MKRFKTPEDFIDNFPEWKEELLYLRAILQSTELEEGIKWGFPVYMIKNKNVIGLGAFKSYVGLWFFNGAFLKDEAGKLMNAQEGKTKGMRQWRFESVRDMDEDLIKAYVEEAIDNQKAGKTIQPAKPGSIPLVLPIELKSLFDNNPDLNQSFEGLTRGKKREYAEYISSAKREATKKSRMEKIIPLILEGKGLNDKYK